MGEYFYDNNKLQIPRKFKIDLFVRTLRNNFCEVAVKR